MDQAILRSGTLSVVNFIFCFAGPYLGFLADLLGLSLRSCRRLHALAGTLAAALAVFHAAAAGAAKGRLDLHAPEDVFALVSILCLCAQLIPLALRRVSYEAALRIHQILSFALAYGLWRHASSINLFPRLYLYIGGALFFTVAIFWLASVLYQNRSGLSTARVSYDNGAIKVTLQLARPLKVKAGQYIGLWIPSASLGSAAQTHPFTVISWSEKPQKHLDLFIEPRGGFTKSLCALSDYGPATRRAMFSGPYGKQLPVHSYENVVMLAAGFGIAAHLPYLRKLIHDQNSRATLTRRIHLVWQIDRTGVGIAAQKLLNEALDEDKLDGEYNLRISIYIKSENINEVKFGDRATAYSGEIPLADVVSSELRERRSGSKTVISVSAKGFIREALNDLLWQNRRSNIDIMYTDYQP
ncbi:ferric-chelate reductase [Beauveria bassiana ARSEF 2860]|uniref:ferric-chelate reductase (NADPH) n=1 Tax=Beauveria bassiana (strain ARSEF 2860) TaxID=655819 RepID=J4WJ57_BEAB2|nr:ferric-chelate reductase [Beauveria bassiana ARSEF 2860]EJP69835.1 ferric-chelate reductase [Beauveria bassiana ARSEF 2860]